MSGLTDQMRANFTLMKDMSQITHKRPDDAMKQVIELFDIMKKNEECQKMMKDWKIEIDNTPLKVNGYLMKVGNYQLGFQNGKDGARVSFNAESTPDIDRKIQNVMYNQPKLEKWAIMYEASQEQVANSFQSNLKECIATFKFNCTPP